MTRGPTVFARDLGPGDLGLLSAVVAGRATLLRLSDAGDDRTMDDAGRCLLDADGKIRAALFPGGLAGGRLMLADPAQRLVTRTDTDAEGLAKLAAALDALGRAPGEERRTTAPVMLVPRLLPDDLCRRLVSALEANSREGTVAILNADGDIRNVELPDRKRRRDLTLGRGDPLYTEVVEAFAKRLAPELWRAWWIAHLRAEAFYVACYQADRSDFFAAHRDNNLPGTANRRLAVSVELNEDYEGGGVVFTEYSDDRWRAPAGGGLVFSCSLLHEAVPVAVGRRYVLLAFLTAPPA